MKKIKIAHMLCIVRVVGAAVLLGLAYAGLNVAFVVTLCVLILTDWLDGKIARWLGETSRTGARLDSLADGSVYTALAISAWWLRPDALAAEWPWLAAAVASYVLNAATSLMRFGCMPSYHTLSAKACWFLTGAAAITFFLDGPLWPVRIALAALTVSNLEGVALSFVLPDARTDVPSVFHTLRTADTPK